MEQISSTLSDILAKSEPRKTLIEHSREAVEFLLRFIEVFSEQIERTARIADVSRDELVSRLFAAVWLHDIGKASHDFQERIHGRSSALGIPHALLSTPFVLAATPPMLKKDGYNTPFEAAAVMSHHTPYYSGLYGDMATNLKAAYIWSAAWEFYQLLASEHYRILGYDYPFPLLEPEADMWHCKNLVGFIKGTLTNEYTAKMRDIFALFAAAIHYGDWLSSGGRTDWAYTVPNLSHQVKASLAKYSGASQDTFASRVAPGIQSRAASACKHLLLIAPTGSGKTEASLLWAGNQPTNRMVYLLPTRVTSNAMYDRVKTFVSDQAGLAHGTAGLVVGETEGYTSQAFQSRLYFSTFMQPATVATVDQLILSKFNWRHWELMETNITQSAVVFDEIHAYDLFTLGLTLNAAQELAERGARLCFMSATMPRFLQDAICKLLGEYGGYDVVECPEADAEIRHTLSVRDSFLEDAIDEIVSLFNGGKKILVVANSVDTACGLYEQLEASIGAENTMLFHSRYIEMERRAKEQSIAEENKRTTGFVAVVTQIVEVSLDIDYDVLYTQVAPVDALVQRFGRVNRKGKKDPVPVCIFHPDERSWKVYEEDVLNNALNLLQKLPPNKPVNQADIFNWVEKQYPHEHWLDKVEKARKDAKQKVRSLRKALWYVQTLRFMDENKALMQLAKTREEKFFTVEAVPVCFRAKVEACKYAAERQNYVVRVPAYLAGGKPHYCEDLGISFAAIDYDPVFGAVNR